MGTEPSCQMYKRLTGSQNGWSPGLSHNAPLQPPFHSPLPTLTPPPITPQQIYFFLLDFVDPSALVHNTDALLEKVFVGKKRK